MPIHCVASGNLPPCNRIKWIEKKTSQLNYKYNNVKLTRANCIWDCSGGIEINGRFNFDFVWMELSGSIAKFSWCCRFVQSNLSYFILSSLIQFRWCFLISLVWLKSLNFCSSSKWHISGDYVMIFSMFGSLFWCERIQKATQTIYMLILFTCAFFFIGTLYSFLFFLFLSLFCVHFSSLIWSEGKYLPMLIVDIKLTFHRCESNM